MILRLSICTFLLSVQTSLGQVSITGGENSSETRLIFDLPAKVEWTTEKTARGYRLWLKGLTDTRFDLSQLFQLISRDRVANVRLVGAAGIEIDLACRCDFIVNDRLSEALLVVIRPIDEPTEQTLMNGSRPKGFGSGAIADQFTPGQSSQASLAEGLSQIVRNESSVALDLLGRELSRAAAQGLIAPTDEVQARPSGPLTNAPEGIKNRSNLSITTGIDAALGSQASGLKPTEVGTICVPDDLVDVASWGDLSDSHQLGRIRREAVSEDGSLSSDGAKRLARHYLFLGFGAEARQVALYIDELGTRQIILALADVMDNLKADGQTFEGQVFCDGDVALWAALAVPIDPANKPTSTNNILSTFSNLPNHLRAHLGPTLAERLRNAGFSEDAQTAINAVTRGGKKTEESTLATAQLNLDGTRADEARADLEALSDGTNVTAAKALLELLLDAESRNMAPNPAWVEDAPTLVSALEGTDISEQLNIAGLRGRIALGQFDILREKLREETPGLTEKARKSLAAHAIETAAILGGDDEFLRAELSFSKLATPEELTNQGRYDVADRLYQLGLPQIAGRYLPDVPKTRRELEISVQILMETGNLSKAQALLENGTEEGLSNQLAEIFLRQGMPEEAINVLSSIGNIDRATETALSIGAWDWISENTSAELSAATQGILGNSATEPDQEKPNGSLIRASRQLREDISVLLNAAPD